MHAIRSRRPSSAHVLAMIALLVALGGSAYAVSLGKNSVKSKQIAKGAVKTKEIANNAVSEAKLKADAVSEAKLRPGAVTALKLGDGAVSESKIAPGAVGPGGLGEIVLRTAQAPLNDGSNAIPEATCLPGERLISGGGAANFSNSPDIAMTSVRPTNGDGTAVQPGEAIRAPGGWSVEFVNPPGGSGNAVAFAMALCLR